ncbi:Hypothetical protein CAP_2758 [Chondromyces apiculatus DSM 436]|uniref:Uncharacterized protein n=1 Tax=Chondromyces apiculatus DSM 436 TaxID=1192034 RepID=A0A017TJ24_9BACT|nr:Hypothetical protein CAP_2758 [Chondromyces apiculatus DSM 436]
MGAGSAVALARPASRRKVAKYVETIGLLADGPGARLRSAVT